MASSSSSSRRGWRTVLTVLIVAAVAILFAVSLASNWDQVRREDLAFSPLWIVAALLFASAVPVSGLLWGAIVDRLTAPSFRVGAQQAISVHIASWLLKYIPGQVGSVVNKVVWGARRGLSRTLILISFIYENVFLQLASIVPSIALLLAVLGVEVFRANPVTLILPLLALIPLLVALVPSWFRTVLNLATTRVLKRDLPDEYVLDVRSTAILLVAFVIPRVLNGAGFVVVASSFTDVHPSNWVLFASAYVLAGAIGILAVFVPSGLGVREAVIFACLIAGGVPAAVAVISAVLARLISSLADGILAIVYAITRHSTQKDDTVR